MLDNVREKELEEPKFVQENKIDGLIILGSVTCLLKVYL